MGLLVSYLLPSTSTIRQSSSSLENSIPTTYERRHFLTRTIITNDNKNALPNYSFHSQQPSQEQQPQEQPPPRIAILSPYSSGIIRHDEHDPTKKKNHNNNQHHDSDLHHTIFPPYMLTFCSGAANVMDFIDFFIFYTNPTNETIYHDWPNLLYHCPSNVKFIYIGNSTLHLAKYFMRVVQHKYKQQQYDTFQTTQQTHPNNNNSNPTPTLTNSETIEKHHDLNHDNNNNQHHDHDSNEPLLEYEE
jgi:hypothetical protein